jgi:hypothetical protein
MKKTTDTASALAAFLASGRTITKCAPAAANATPLRVLRKLAEQDPTGRPLGRVQESDAELRAEEDAEIFGAAYASGCGANAALEELNYVRSRRR